MAYVPALEPSMIEGVLQFFLAFHDVKSLLWQTVRWATMIGVTAAMDVWEPPNVCRSTLFLENI